MTDLKMGRDNKIKILIVDKNLPRNLVEKLREKGYVVIFSLSLGNITGALSTHPDIQLCKISDNFVVVEPCTYEYYKNALTPYGIIVKTGMNEVSGDYPGDTFYNVATNGDVAIHNFDYTDDVILENLECEKIHVRQGYGKCNVLFAKKLIITSDMGIYKKLKDKKLLIRPGFIELSGYEYGFIGGASGYGDKLYFIGNIECHPDYKIIKNFLEENNILYESLGQGALKDYGSLIFLNTREELCEK